MAAYTTCTLCAEPGTLAGAKESGKIHCNVRQFQEDVFTLWRCTGCGSIHCAEAADLPTYYAEYPLKQQKMTFSERLGYRNRLRLLTKQGMQASHRLLDYGCGAGLFVSFLRENGYPESHGYDEFVPAFADRRALEGPYDAVASYDVIEHDEDPPEFMRSLSRLVTPGGLLVIGTPNADHVSISDSGDPSLHPPYHRHILSERMLLRLGAEQGLTPTTIRRRSFYDSVCPTVNSRFMWRYIQRTGGLLDVVVGPPQVGLVTRSPDLIFLALFGYFLPLGDYIIVSFRKS
jgi:SAM-dependent methyltransferase